MRSKPTQSQQLPLSPSSDDAAERLHDADNGDEWTWGKGSLMMLKSCVEKLKVGVL
jgi:hypothetical protein